MNVLFHNLNYSPESEDDACHFASLDELFANADIISLHCPLVEGTRGIINKQNISRIKDGVMIINTARGPLVVEKDLKDALNSGKVGGAALDVVSSEPIELENELLKAKNCIITPHIAWAPREFKNKIDEYSC